MLNIGVGVPGAPAVGSSKGSQDTNLHLLAELGLRIIDGVLRLPNL